MLYDRVVEVDERVTLLGYTSDPKRQEREVQFDEDGKVTRGYDGDDSHIGSDDVVRGLSGEAVLIQRRPDRETVKEQLRKVFDDGFKALAVVFIHSYTFPDHEKLIGEIARDIGFEHVSLSSSAMPMIKAVPRGTSSTADAYLTPVLQRYIDGFFSGFEASLRDGVDRLASVQQDDGASTHTSASQAKDLATRTTTVEFMRSDGGLTDVKSFSGLTSILSGPAGGVVGYALTSWDSDRKQPVIGLDMGGTSTDVSRYAGEYELVFETTTAGISIQSPQLDISE